jgi:hypothetical protein
LAEYLEIIAEKRNTYGVLVGKPVGRDNLEDLDLEGKTITIDIEEIE